MNGDAEQGRTAPRWPAPFVAVIALVSSWPHWWPGRVVVSFDGATYSGPNTRVTAEALLAGRIPFLNPWIFGGAPHLGNHHTGVLSPPRWLVLPFDPLTANGLLVAGHLILLGVATVWLMRRLDVGALGAATAGVVAVLSGAPTATSVQFEQILVLAWAPLLLWAIAGVTDPEAGHRRTAALAVVVALTVVSGHPQMVLEVGVLAAVFTVALLVGRERRRAWRRLAVGGALGVGMAGAQLAATVAASTAGALDRGRSVEELSGAWFVLRVRSAATATFGTILDRPPDAFSGAFESILWVGVVAVLLAAAGLVAGVTEPRHRHWALGITAVAALSGIWALGPRTPLWRLAADVVPAFSSIRVSARWLDIVALCVALLAGLGVDALARQRRRGLVAAPAVVVALVAGATLLGPLDDGGTAVAVAWALTAVATLAVIVLAPMRWRPVVLSALVLVELAAMARTSIPYRLVQDHPPTAEPPSVVLDLAERTASGGGWAIALTPDTGNHDDLVAGLRPNANAFFDIASIDGYDGGVQVTDRWAAAARRFTPEPPVDLPLRNAIGAPVPAGQLGRLGVRWILLSNDRAPSEWVPDLAGPIAADDRFTLWENPRWFGDAVVWSTWTEMDRAAIDAVVPGGEVADVLRQRFAALGDTALVESSGDLVEPVGCDSGCGPVGADLVRRSAEHLVVTVDVDRPSIVSVAAQAIPGWSATIDGEAADVVVVDGLLLGVGVPAGDHTIEFRFTPWWWWPGATVSVLASVATATLAWRGRRRLPADG
jgi:hypothetical protein